MLKRLIFTLTLVVSTFAVAQDSTTPQWQLNAGYQYIRMDTGFVQDALNLAHDIDPSFPQVNFGRHQSMHGWNFGAQENINSWLSGVVDVSGNYHTNRINVATIGNIKDVVRTRLRLYTVMGGPQFTLRRSSHVEPFARMLIGGAFSSASINELENNVPLFAEDKVSDSGFAIGGGAGADLFFSKHVGLRVSADYIRTDLFSQPLNNFRGTAGLVFRFGSK